MGCHTCGSPLPPKKRPAGRAALYCSELCRHLRGRQSAETPFACRGCAAPLTPKTYRGNQKIWCSRACAAWTKRNGQPRPRHCAQCGIALRLRARPDARFCSGACAAKASYHPTGGSGWTAVERSCENCRTPFQSKGDPRIRFCSRRCRDAAWSRARDNTTKSQLRRARKHGVDRERFTNEEIAERDGWRCGICGVRINRRVRPRSPRALSLDHIVPLSAGGTHTRDNVQASHFGCNSRKGTRGGIGSQLRLVG